MTDPSFAPPLTGGGDLSSTPLGPQQVQGLAGRPLSPSAPSANQALVWNSTSNSWTPTSIVTTFNGATGAVVGTQVLVSGTKTSNVTTTGTTFATAASLLSSPLSFTADGTSSYLVRVNARAWFNSGAGNLNILYISLDSSQNATIATYSTPTANYESPLSVAGLLVTPSAGTHTINARFAVNAGTGTIYGGSGGASNNAPIYLTLSRGA